VNSYLHRRRHVFIEDYSPPIIDNGHPAETFRLSDAQEACEAGAYASMDVVPPGPTPTLEQEIARYCSLDEAGAICLKEKSQESKTWCDWIFVLCPTFPNGLFENGNEICDRVGCNIKCSDLFAVIRRRCGKILTSSKRHVPYLEQDARQSFVEVLVIEKKKRLLLESQLPRLSKMNWHPDRIVRKEAVTRSKNSRNCNYSQKMFINYHFLFRRSGFALWDLVARRRQDVADQIQ